VSHSLTELLRHLPDAATSPLALVAYVVCVVAWLAIAWRVKRHQHLLSRLSDLRPSDRLAALEQEVAGVKLAGGISPEQWLKQRVYGYYFGAFALLCLVAMVLFAIANTTEDRRRTMPTPSFSDPPHSAEVASWDLFKLWARRHPEFFDIYGIPRTIKFVDVHDQPFERGFAIYNVSDAWCVWIFDTSRFAKTGPAKDLTPGSGRSISETVFAEATSGITVDQRNLYRRLVEQRTRAAIFDEANGLIGSIATGYISNRLYDRLGTPLDRERMTLDACYAQNENYEVIAGLRHSVGMTSPTAPKSVYVLYRTSGLAERDVIFPAHHQ
jgi:hypothetical protein